MGRTVLLLALLPIAAASADVKRHASAAAQRIMRVEERSDVEGHGYDALLEVASGPPEEPPGDPVIKVTAAPVSSVKVELTPDDGIKASADGFPCHKPVNAMNVAADQTCNSQCPYWAESALVDEPCHFRCVRKDECGVWGQGILGNATVADPLLYCRRCFSAACLLCHAHEDRCVDCQPGYELNADGRCEHLFSNIRYFTYTMLACFLTYVVCWAIELFLRHNVNDEGVRVGLTFRSRTKLRMGKSLAQQFDTALASSPHVEGAPAPEGGAIVAAGADVSGQAMAEAQDVRPLWPLTTNLLKEPAGGPGLVLHMRFQVFWILWGGLAAIAWIIVAHAHNKDLLKLGLIEAPTPRHLCRVVEWGATVAHESVHMKVGFCIFVYVATFLGSAVFALRQLNYCQFLDRHTTMKDYAALISGLPKMQGSVPVETDLTDLVKQETQVEVIGVSVCWDIHDKVDVIKDMLEEDFEAMRQPEPIAPGAEGEPLVREIDRPMSPMEYRGLRWRLFGFIDRMLLMVCGVPDKFEKDENVDALVNEMETTPYAWVVFGSEQARDEAYEIFKTRQVMFNGSRLKMTREDEEPESVRWQDMNVSPYEIPMRIVQGVFKVLLCMAGWAVFFYLPYAFYMSTMEYDANHQEPSGIEFTILGFVVLGGNVTLYLICSLVAEGVGFHSQATMESLYMILYFSAVVTNVFLDVAVTGYISYRVMVGAGARTWGGKLVAELDTVQAVVESYPIQKALGYMLFAYSMPASFLVPFLIEPIALIFMPYFLMKKVVRSNPFLKTWRAERAMAIFAPMDSGRYADLLINVTLATMILYVPSGWTVWIFSGIFVSHVYIYLFDHYRVLRSVPGFMFPDSTIDMNAWKLSSVPCAIVLVVIFMKANCTMGTICLQGNAYWAMIGFAFFGHIAFHVFVLDKIVPLFMHRQHVRTDLKYQQVASVMAATWFTTNPAYCLRSKYMYKHDPPVGFHIRGKEHLLRSSPQGGHYFEDKPCIAEKY